MSSVRILETHPECVVTKRFIVVMTPAINLAKSLVSSVEVSIPDLTHLFAPVPTPRSFQIMLNSDS